MRNIEFVLGPYGTAVGQSSDRHFVDLGSQLTSDIQNYAPDCLLMLQSIDDVTSGACDHLDFEGNSAIVHFRPDGVTVESLGPVPRATTYTVDEAREVILRYFTFLAPTSAQRKRHVATWERENGRSFPGRSLLDLDD